MKGDWWEDLAPILASGVVALAAWVAVRFVPFPAFGLGSFFLAVMILAIGVCTLKLMQLVRRF